MIAIKTFAIKNMKKLFYILLVISLYTCKSKVNRLEKIEQFYPSKELFNEQYGLVEINLETTKLNFKEITNLSERFSENDSVPYLTFKANDTVKKILLMTIFGVSTTSYSLTINKDTIHTFNRKYSNKRLYKALKEYYESEKEAAFNHRNRKPLIVIELDTNATSKDLFKKLNYLTHEFDKLNKTHQDTLELKVGLTYFSQIPGPPPLLLIKNSKCARKRRTITNKSLGVKLHKFLRLVYVHQAQIIGNGVYFGLDNLVTLLNKVTNDNHKNPCDQ